MKKELLAVSILILISSFVLAIPPSPSAFYGSIEYNNESIPNGYFITAKLDGVISGVCEIEDGTYGYGANTLIVLSYNQINGPVKFYIGDNEIGEHDFIDKGVTKLDFVLDSFPEDSENPVDGECDVGAGECLFNALDCNPQKTNACAGNERCDIEIGEDCSNTPQDCSCLTGYSCVEGVCQINDNDGGDDGGGNGGNDGGGNGGGSPGIITLTTNTDNDTIDLDYETIGDNETNLDSNKETKTTGSGITGAVIGFVKSGKGIVSLVFVILVIALGIGVITFKSKSKVQQ